MTKGDHAAPAADFLSLTERWVPDVTLLGVHGMQTGSLINGLWSRPMNIHHVCDVYWMSGHFLWLAVTSCCYQHVLFSCSSDESLDCTDIPGQCLSVLMIKCINFVAAGCHSSHSGSFKWEAFKQLSNLKSSSHTSCFPGPLCFSGWLGREGVHDPSAATPTNFSALHLCPDQVGSPGWRAVSPSLTASSWTLS